MGPIRGQVDASVGLQASEWAKGFGSMSEDKFSPRLNWPDIRNNVMGDSASRDRHQEGIR